MVIQLVIVATEATIRHLAGRNTKTFYKSTVHLLITLVVGNDGYFLVLIYLLLTCLHDGCCLSTSQKATD